MLFEGSSTSNILMASLDISSFVVKHAVKLIGGIVVSYNVAT